MYRPVRGVWTLLAIGGATAVGLTTHDAGFTAITFIGTLLLPRALGFGRHGHRHGPAGWGSGCGRREREESGAGHASSSAGAAQA